LDFGIGTGEFALRLAKKGFKVSVLENKLIERDQSVDSIGLRQCVKEHEKPHLLLI
jgi:2-polyprenyl-3-methyl-5-hydroxy-6-metoxy-1,4-benzoquinol methylase